jgi:predicted nuclease of predicted toxin-antitoxin system
MKLTLFLDEDVQVPVATALRRRGFNVLHAQEAMRKGRPDEEQWMFAQQEQRALFTYNVKDFIEIHNESVRKNKDHWGIILSKQRTFSETFHRLLHFLQSHSHEEVRNRIFFL